MKTGLLSLSQNTENEKIMGIFCPKNYSEQNRFTEEMILSEIKKPIHHHRKKYLKDPQQKTKPKPPKHPKNPNKIYVKEKQVRDYRRKK
ncbi:MAG: hypothetical protein PHR00_03020 [Patescibacteria group bacterium]|nr:hypothetical protein [Patescibacteria group bacterium]